MVVHFKTPFLLTLVLLLFSCASPPPYVASRAVLEKTQPDREIIPARKGCDVCHRIFTERLVYKYNPVRISHRSHAELGIECIFCHRAAAESVSTGDYLMPEGHGFDNKFGNNTSIDRNPCRTCHLYSSAFGKKDKNIPAGCRTCHPSYSEGTPLPYQWWKFKTTLKNSHKTHYDRGIYCLRCHPGFDLLEETTSNYIPRMDICEECHAEIRQKGRDKPEDADSFKKVELLYIQNCAMCHGRDGRGDGPVAAFFKAGLRPRDFSDAEKMSKRTDRQIHDVILKGGPELGLSERMPAWEGLLAEDEIEELARYVRTLGR